MLQIKYERAYYTTTATVYFLLALITVYFLHSSPCLKHYTLNTLKADAHPDQHPLGFSDLCTSSSPISLTTVYSLCQVPAATVVGPARYLHVAHSLIQISLTFKNINLTCPCTTYFYCIEYNTFHIITFHISPFAGSKGPCGARDPR